jgi:pimeloyl-ACP methyl ester carboxylesterase
VSDRGRAVQEGTLGQFPCLVAGEGDPLIMLAGLSPDVGVAHARRMHERALLPYAGTRRVYYLNRRADLPQGMTMRALAAEHAQAIRAAFESPVDVIGLSTGGSIAQQLAADHPAVVRRLVLISSACRLGPTGQIAQRRVCARLRAGTVREALAVMAAALVPPRRGQLAAAVLASAIGPWLLAGVASFHDMATTIEAEDAFDLARCPPVRAPTLLIAGARDRFYGPRLFEETATLIADCRLSLHPRRGHITVTATPRCAAEALGFLSFPANSASGLSR